MPKLRRPTDAGFQLPELTAPSLLTGTEGALLPICCELEPLWVDSPILNREYRERHILPLPGIDAARIMNFRRGSTLSQHEREKLKLLQRVRRLRGQLDAVERSPMGDEDCGAQLMLLAAVHGGINGLMGEVLEDHIRFHLTAESKEQIASDLAEDLIDLVRAYLK